MSDDAVILLVAVGFLGFLAFLAFLALKQGLAEQPSTLIVEPTEKGGWIIVEKQGE